MENVEVFLKFDPRYGDAEKLDRRIFDAAIEYYSYIHAKKVESMTKEDAYKALVEFREYSLREQVRWTYLEHKIRELMHDTSAFTIEEPSIAALHEENFKDLPLETHFAVFNRDQFACRYCGTTGVEEELEIDYAVHPVDGGTLDFDNIVTTCVDCKNKVLLSRSRPKPPAMPRMKRKVVKQ